MEIVDRIIVIVVVEMYFDSYLCIGFVYNNDIYYIVSNINFFLVFLLIEWGSCKYFLIGDFLVFLSCWRCYYFLGMYYYCV